MGEKFQFKFATFQAGQMVITAPERQTVCSAWKLLLLLRRGSYYYYYYFYYYHFMALLESSFRAHQLRFAGPVPSGRIGSLNGL